MLLHSHYSTAPPSIKPGPLVKTIIVIKNLGRNNLLRFLLLSEYNIFHSKSTIFALQTERLSSYKARFKGNFLEYGYVIERCSSSYTFVICSTLFKYDIVNTFYNSSVLDFSHRTSITWENSSIPLRLTLNIWEQIINIALYNWLNFSDL